MISGPVWEYYNGPNWRQGLENEIIDDRLCGFVGKTVIHPNQIEVVNASYKITKHDLEDAKAILNWGSKFKFTRFWQCCQRAHERVQDTFELGTSNYFNGRHLWHKITIYTHH